MTTDEGAFLHKAAIASVVAVAAFLACGQRLASAEEQGLAGLAGADEGPPLRAFYVDGTNGNDGWDGRTQSTAWKTIDKANQALRPGDAVYIRAGTYTNQAIVPSSTGTSDKPIIYSSYSNESVILEGAAPWAIHLEGKAYIKVHGLTVRRCAGMLHIVDGSSHNEISHCTFDQYVRGEDGRFAWGGSRVWQSSYNWIHHCTFSRWGLVSKRGQDLGACLDIGWHKYESASHNLVENNVLFFGGHHVLGFSGTRNVIRNNYMHNERWMENPTRPGTKSGNRCIIGEKGSRNLIEDNRLAFAGEPPDDDGAFGCEFSSRSNILRRNVFCWNGTAGVGVHSKRFAAADSNYLYSNTFYRNGVDDAIKNFHKGGISIQNYRGSAPQGNVIKNNLFSQNFEGRAFAVGGNVRLDAQVVANNWKEAGDPLFVDIASPSDPFDPDLPDVHLRAGSPCIDKGGWLTTITSPSGSGRAFTVEDADYFMDGWGIIQGDLIQLQGGRQRARITHVDYDTNAITVDRDVRWAQAMGVSLAYEGARPDVGAHEFGRPGAAQNSAESGTERARGRERP